MHFRLYTELLCSAVLCSAVLCSAVLCRAELTVLYCTYYRALLCNALLCISVLDTEGLYRVYGAALCPIGLRREVLAVQCFTLKFCKIFYKWNSLCCVSNILADIYLDI